MEQQMPSKPNEEVDIVKLMDTIFKKVTNLFNKLFQIVLSIALYLRGLILENLKIWGLSTFIFLSISGYIYYNNIVNKIKVQAIIHSPYLKGLLFKEYVDKLNNLALTEKYDLLAKTLDIPLNLAMNINEIKIQYFDIFQGLSESYLKRNNFLLDSLVATANQDNENFTIILTINKEIGTDETISLLQEKVITFIKKNTYLNQNYNSALKSLELSKQFLLKQLEQLDTIEKVSINVIKNSIKSGDLALNTAKSIKESSSNINIKLDVVTPSLNITTSKKKIFESLEKTEKLLESTESIELIAPFTPFFIAKEEIKEEIKNIAFLIYGLVFVFFVFKDTNNYLENYKRNK